MKLRYWVLLILLLLLLTGNLIKIYNWAIEIILTWLTEQTVNILEGVTDSLKENTIETIQNA